MLANLQRSLPFTLALAIIVYLVLLLIPDLALSASVLVAVGVVLGGVLVPILVEVKGSTLDSTGPHAAATGRPRPRPPRAAGDESRAAWRRCPAR